LDFDIDLNLRGPLNRARVVIGQIRSCESGKIINISLTSGITGIEQAIIYSVANGGITVFTKAPALEVLRSGICINNIAPGLAKTGFVHDAPQVN